MGRLLARLGLEYHDHAGEWTPNLTLPPLRPCHWLPTMARKSILCRVGAFGAYPDKK